MNTFNELKIKDEILRSLSDMGFTEPTPIQKEVIPYMLEGKDCLAQAPTGTGKTCAFGIPLADMTDAEDDSVQAIVMCPTRELAMQTEKEIKKLVSNLRGIKVLAIYGGQNFSRQLLNLKKKPQIIVGTPGRVLDHLSRHTLKLDKVKTLVLDEADEMLNMGFREDIDEILKNIKGKAQTVLFSATMSKEILDISRNYQTDPVTVKTTLNKSDLPVIKQYFVKLKDGDKAEALKKIIADKDYHLVLCFCNTKRKVDELTEKLNAAGMLASGLHGDLRQRQRDIIMQSYRNRNINILVATDVAARGIDVNNVEAVFNYDIPLDDEYYIHRIGRTARANKTGESYSFATARDLHRIKECERYTKTSMEELSLAGLSDANLTTKKQKFSDTPSVRFFLNLGAKDELNDRKIIELITGNTSVKEKDILEIKILDLFSFLEIEKTVCEDLLALNGEKYKRRVISVEKAEAASKGRGRKPSGFSSGADRKKTFTRTDDRKPSFSRGDRDSKRFSKPEVESKEGKSAGDAYYNKFKKEGPKKYSDKPAYDSSEKRSFSKEGGYGKRDDSKRTEFGKRDYTKKTEYGKRDDSKKTEFGKRDYTKKTEYGKRDDSKRTEFGKREGFKKDGEYGKRDDFKKTEFGKSDFKKTEFGKSDYKKPEFGKSEYKKTDEKRSYAKPSKYGDSVKKDSGFKAEKPEYRKSKTAGFSFKTKRVRRETTTKA